MLRTPRACVCIGRLKEKFEFHLSRFPCVTDIKFPSNPLQEPPSSSCCSDLRPSNCHFHDCPVPLEEQLILDPFANLSHFLQETSASHSARDNFAAHLNGFHCYGIQSLQLPCSISDVCFATKDNAIELGNFKGCDRAQVLESPRFDCWRF